MDDLRTVLDSSGDLSLRDAQNFQRCFDRSNWSSPAQGESKRRHIGFHLTIAAGKLARVEERLDHGVVQDEIVQDVAADLLVYALQLADLLGDTLDAVYRRRLLGLLAGTPNLHAS